MKQSIFTIIEHTALTKDVYRMVLAGDTSAITASGQFVNILLEATSCAVPSPSVTGTQKL